jgi:hypothetical protein
MNMDYDPLDPFKWLRMIVPRQYGKSRSLLHLIKRDIMNYKAQLLLDKRRPKLGG